MYIFFIIIPVNNKNRTCAFGFPIAIVQRGITERLYIKYSLVHAWVDSINQSAVSYVTALRSTACTQAVDAATDRQQRCCSTFDLLWAALYVVRLYTSTSSCSNH